jgi:hypothetical protein
MAGANMSLGGLPLRVNPHEVRWNFKMKVADTPTMGGKVIQILGTTLSDLTVSGKFGRGLRDKGDLEGWESELRFRDQVKKWAQQAEESEKPKPLRFTYSPTSHTVENINPEWQLTLFPVDDGAMRVVDGVKDLYIARLMDGVGWKQSEYNGPTQAEVDQTLDPFGGSVPDYYRDRISKVFTSGNTVVGPTSPAAPGTGGTEVPQ